MKKKHLLIKREGCVIGEMFGLSCSLQTSFDLHEPTPCRPIGAGGPLCLCSYLALPPKPDLCIFHIPLVLVPPNQIAFSDRYHRCHPPNTLLKHPPLNVVDYLVLWISVCAVCKRFDQIIWIGLFLVSLFANGPDLPWWCLREKYKYKSGKS